MIFWYIKFEIFDLIHQIWNIIEPDNEEKIAGSADLKLWYAKPVQRESFIEKFEIAWNIEDVFFIWPYMGL